MVGENAVSRAQCTQPIYIFLTIFMRIMYVAKNLN